MGAGGFEPPKAEPTGLQPVPFGRSGTPPGTRDCSLEPMPTYDVAVIGAGPGGSTAAYRLACAGVRVLLIDKATFPRDKPCGGGVTLRAARLLPFSIEPVVEDVVDRLDCRLNYGTRFARLASAPLAYMTQRVRLDHFLLEQA